MSDKYYAIKKGRSTGIVDSWKKCYAQVHRFKGAIYKGFETEGEAQAWFIAGTSDADEFESLDLNALPPGTAVAFVDGSYDPPSKHYSAGIVFFYESRQHEEFSILGNDEELAEMRNIAGEILAAKYAIGHAVRNGADKLYIVHDYQGISSWCTGEWSTNKEGTKEYKEFFTELTDFTSVSFVKVKGHSDNEHNDRADYLAKKALGLA